MEIHRIEDAAAFSRERASKVALAAGEHCRVTLWCLEPSQEIRPHAHAGDHVWVVHEGRGSFLTSEGEHAVGPGSVVFAPAGEVHGMRAESRLLFASVSAG
jgi:quercetin dioxygenase-like cupin family protein